MDPQFANDVEEDSPTSHTSVQEEEERSQSQVKDNINMSCCFNVQYGQQVQFLQNGDSFLRNLIVIVQTSGRDDNSGGGAKQS